MKRLALSICVTIALLVGSVYAAPIPVVGVSATSDDGNIPANAIDGDLATRWSAMGNGQAITFQLESCATVGSIDIAWYQGDTRRAQFDVQVSVDGGSWTEVFSGESSGDTTGFENVEFPNMQACAVRIVGYGNTRSEWNSITEVVILDASAEAPEAPVGVSVPRLLLEELCAPLFATP